MENVDEIVAERLVLLRNEVDYLKDERDRLHSFNEYADNARLKRAVERSLQVAIEICLDIGRRIIVIEGYTHPDSNKKVFRVLIQENVLPADLRQTLNDMAGFRNLVVHDYARIDDARVYGILQKRLEDFDAFANAIRVWLSDENDGK